MEQIIKWFKQFFKKDTEPKPKTYTYSVIDKSCIGDLYTYKVTANSREEASKLLFRYFDKPNFEANEAVKSDHHTVSYAGSFDARPRDNNIFNSEDAHYFARMISGSGFRHMSKNELAKYDAWQAKRQQDWRVYETNN